MYEEPKNVIYKIINSANSIDIDTEKYQRMTSNKNEFFCEVDKKNSIFNNIMFTHIFIKAEIYPEELDIELYIGGRRFNILNLLLLKQMNLVKEIKNGFVVRIPFDLLVGYLLLRKMLYHNITLSINNNKYIIHDIYYLIENSEIVSSKLTMGYYFNTTIYRDTNLIPYNIKKLNNVDEHIYKYRVIFDSCKSYIFGILITCNISILKDISLVLCGNDSWLQKPLLKNCIVNNNLLWIPIYDRYNESKLLNTNCSEFCINLSLTTKYNNISITACSCDQYKRTGGMLGLLPFFFHNSSSYDPFYDIDIIKTDSSFITKLQNKPFCICINQKINSNMVEYIKKIK